MSEPAFASDPAQLRSQIQEQIRSQPVLLFMKGRPDAPHCGFSSRAVAALDALGVEYASVNVLEDPHIRQELSALSGWPTIPQLFVKGELVGGSDIMAEMFDSGELAQLLEVDHPAAEPHLPDPPATSAPLQLQVVAPQK